MPNIEFSFRKYQWQIYAKTLQFSEQTVEQSIDISHIVRLQIQLYKKIYMMGEREYTVLKHLS